MADVAPRSTPPGSLCAPLPREHERCHEVPIFQNPTERVEAMTTPEGAKGWVDQAGSAHDLAGGHGLDVAPDASPEGVRAETRREEDGAGGEPSNAPVAEWLPVKTSDWRLRGLRDRHYAGGVGGATVGQPGKRIAFVTFEGTAGWVSHWPKPEFIDHAFGEAFVCTLFRKECAGLASLMIEDAIRRTEARWGAPPPGGWLTFVDPAEVESPNPGYCFKCAGFEPVGFTKDRGLLVLRRAQVVSLEVAA